VRITLTSKLTNQRVTEGSSFPLTANVYSDSADVWSLSVPSSLRYRIDDPDRGCTILDWTTLTPDDENSIVVTGAQNAIQDQCSREERRQLTIQANAGLDTQYAETFCWSVVNLAGIS
jgi:hypothetical protein